MVNSKLLKCCPGCGSNDDRNWIFAKKPRKKTIVKVPIKKEPFHEEPTKKEPVKMEPIPPAKHASKPDIFEMLGMLHELETGQSGRKSAGEFFLNQPGMLLLKEAWPEIDAKMKAKEKAITTACELSDDE